MQEASAAPKRPNTRLRPQDFIRAAGVPLTVQPQVYGLWTIERRPWQLGTIFDRTHYTILRHLTLGTLHQGGDVVMEDGVFELVRHLPIWLAAKGTVLITGLGLGCVVRALLINPAVTHIDVVERDGFIIKVVGAEFVGNPRVTIHQRDAMDFHFPPTQTWDYAWHDLWSDDDEASYHRLHAQLILGYHGRVKVQGAWIFPRKFARMYQKRIGPLLGSPKFPDMKRKRDETKTRKAVQVFADGPCAGGEGLPQSGRAAGA